MRLNHPKFISTLSALIIFIFYIYNIISYTEKMDISNQKIISKHADVISDDIWRFDKSSAEKYLNLALEANYYESISVILSTNENFLSINMTPKERLDELLIQYNLIRKKEYKAKIIVDNHSVGILSAVVYIRNIYYYFYAFLVSLLLFMITAFITYLIFSKKLLNRTVLEKTAELQESQERLKNILQANPDPIVVYDKQGFPQYMSPSFSKIFGWNLEELRGKIIPFVPEKEKKITFKKIKEIFDHGRPLSFETKRYTKNGRCLDIYLSAAVNKNEAGKSIGLVVNLTDITEKKALENKYKQAQKMEAIGILTGGIAHDFNNILTIILGHSELVLNDIPKSNTIYKNLKKIREAGFRAADIVRQLLNFSRKSEQEIKTLKLSTMINDSLKLLKSLIPSNIEIKRNYKATDEIILADPIQVNQILMNLCINASQEMEREGGVIEITLDNIQLNEDAFNQFLELKESYYVRMTVSDTGSGIDPQLIDRIFDPYFTTKEMGKGSGMGLSVVHGIVKTFNGDISVSSELGKGTTFTILFPVAEEKIKSIENYDETMIHGSEKVLFVDDDDEIAELTKESLENIGYQVETRMNPLEAIELFKSKPHYFDLVITDMTMPHMTGDKLAKELLKIAPDIPIIICTGYSSIIDDVKAKQIGVDGFLMKPVKITTLSKTIREVLG